MKTKEITALPYEEPQISIIEIETEKGILSASATVSVEGFDEKEETW